MLRQLSLIIALACGAQFAHAAEAGKVIFVAGSALVADKAVGEGAVVQEGDLLSTGATGFMYVKTIDNGLFILRPNTKARIAAYHVDAKDPTNTRIKLELLSGVARSRSGEAVKLARQNFRFNTPVAAIGVRGTDFTVFTDQDTSRVAVISGGIVVSGFGGACRPDGSGPCEGVTSRELSASQRGVLLQIQRGQSAPQLMQGNAIGPDQIAPPRIDEPIGKNSGVNSASTVVASAPSLDAQKGQTLNQAKLPPTNPVVTVPPAPPVVVTEPPVPPKPDLPDSKIVWGRWQPLIDSPAKFDLTAAKAKAELVAVMGNFALLRTEGKEFLSPNEGKAGFALKESEAYIFTEIPTGQKAELASLSNGKLNIDFAARTFSTSVDLVGKTVAQNLQATGMVTDNGRLFSEEAWSRRGYMDVRGLLGTENGGSAAYIFSGRLDAERTYGGSTYWQSTPAVVVK